MDNELRKSIEQGTSLSKVPEEERKKREEEKKKRLEELKRIEEKLSGSGKDISIILFFLFQNEGN